MTVSSEARLCARCRRVLVDEDDVGWYYQTPVETPEVPGLVFMDRVHHCDGKPHLVIAPEPYDATRRCEFCDREESHPFHAPDYEFSGRHAFKATTDAAPRPLEACPMTTSKPKTPTASGISRLLAAAGFKRGVSRPEDLAADGYAVIPNRPGDGIVLVSWWGGESERGEMPGRYTEALEAAGYSAHQSGDGPYLVVTAKTED